MAWATYAQPEVLVSTGWVAEHLNDPKVKLIEVDVDTTRYDKGHIRGAIGWNWQTDLNDRVRRDVIDPRTFAELCRRGGINAGRHGRVLRRQQQLVRRVGAVAVQVSRPQGRAADERRAKEVGAGEARR